MSGNGLEKLLDGLIRIKSGMPFQVKTVLEHREKDISLSTDKFLHQEITELIRSLSDLPVLSEEDEHPLGFLEQKENYWIIDPLDGTVNYFRGIPVSCISIALWRRHQPIIGILVDLNRDEVFQAVLEKNDLTDQTGAWLNDRPIRVSSVERKGLGILATGFPADYDFETDALMSNFRHFQRWQKVRLLGSAALSLAWVGCGRLDAYVEEGIHIWDVAAGLAVVKAAGGEFILNPLRGKNRVVLAATNGQIPAGELLPRKPLP